MPDEIINNGTGGDPAQAFQNLLAKHNNDNAALASKLFDENFQLRAKNRELVNGLPKADAVILSGDDAKRWNEFKELDFAAARAALEKLPELEKSNRELARMENFREVANIGLDGTKLKTSVLKKLMAEFPDTDFEFKTTKDKDGKEQIAAYTRTGEKVLPFSEFANENFADFLPALKEAADTQPAKTGNTGDPVPHSTTKADVVKSEVAAQMQTGRYNF